jgi:acyl-CoA dehydrogenase
MEILNYTDDHHRFRERLRAFLEKEVIPHVDQWEKDGIIPKTIWKKMGRAGFLCPSISKEYGGLGGDFLYSAIVIEELSKTHQTGLAAGLHSDVVVPYIDTFATEAQKQKYLPGCVNGDIVTAVAMTEPGAGSDLAGMSTVAVEEEDTVVLNGSKTFISNGMHSDLVIIAAKDPSIENPYNAISLFIIESDTPGFKRGRKLDKMGWKSQDTAELFFTNCRIPKTNRLGDKGAGFLMLMDKLQQERLACAIGAICAAERILEWTIDYCKHTSISGKPISKNQAAQFKLVEMATQVKLGRTFVDKLIRDHMAGEHIVVETAMAKYWTTDMVKDLADTGLDLFGNNGFLEAYPMARAWRDVHGPRLA